MSILAGYLHFEVKKMRIIHLEERTPKLAFKIRLPCVREGIAPLSVSHIGFDNCGIMDLVCWKRISTKF